VSITNCAASSCGWFARSVSCYWRSTRSWQAD